MSGGGSSSTTESTQDSSGEFQTSEAGGFYNMPVAPEGFYENWMSFLPGQDALNPFISGITDAASTISGLAPGFDPIRQKYGDVYDLLGAYTQRSANTLEGMKANWPELYGEDPTVTAATIAPVDDINARTGAEFMEAYYNPFEDQVYDAVMADLDAAYGEDQVASDMAAAASGAFGGGRHGVRDAVLADRFLRTRGRTGADIRSRGFETAATLGQTDAQRKLAAAAANQQAALQRAIQQAALETSASRENAFLLDSRQKFDANQADEADDRRIGAALSQAGLLDAEGNLIGDEAALSATSAGLLGAAGSLSTAEYQQLLNWLQSGTPLIGQEGVAVGTSEGTQSSTTTGTSTTQTSPGLFDWLSLAASPFSFGFGP